MGVRGSYVSGLASAFDVPLRCPGYDDEMVGKRNLAGALLIGMLVCAATVAAQGTGGVEGGPAPGVTPPDPPRWWVGGGIGMSFGEYVNYVEFSPQVAYQIAPRFQLGATLIYRYRKDKRYEPALSTTDYGGSILGRYLFFDPVFVQLEVERIIWEFPRLIDDEGFYEKVEADYTGLYAGLGFALPAGPRSRMFMVLLYDFNYTSSEPSPNSDPWVIRIGYGFGL